MLFLFMKSHNRPSQVIIDNFKNMKDFIGLSKNIELHWNTENTEKEKEISYLFSQNQHVTELKTSQPYKCIL